MKALNFSLGFKMIIVVVFGVLVIFSIIGMYRLNMEKNNLMDKLESSGKERAALIAESLSNLIIAYDYSNIESLAERIVKMQDVHQINVLDRNGKLMVNRKTEEYQPEMQGLVFTAPVVFSGVTIGQVELLISLDRYEQGIRTVYRNVGIAIFLVTTFFVGLIYFTITRFVARPLARLSRAADQLAIGNYAAELPPAAGDEMGTLVRAFASMRESRKVSEARLKAVFDHSPDAFIQLDANGNIIDWNDKATEIWGYRKLDVLGKNFCMLLPPTESGMNEGYRKCYQDTVNVIGKIRELVGQRSDGGVFPLELRTSEIHLDREVAFLVLARDITERKENENKLREAMQAAESANAAKSAFLSNMSHEIRTPMNSIIGMTKLVSKTSLNAKQHDYLSKIDYSANHLLGLINDILDFSKIEANKLELDQTNFALSALFEGLSGQLAHSASYKGLKLEFRLDSALHVPLRGDPMRVSQILMNYISNAIKFTEQGGVTVSAHLAGEQEDNLLVRFEVLDTGIGLHADEIEKLFRPFHQADASTTRKFGGTGLGLAISKQLVELMGGEVGVESTPGRGSRFWFSVKFGRGGEIDTAHNRVTPVDISMLRGASILLVEDNPFNQQVAVELLNEAGVGVSIAGNGQEALDMLKSEPYDCVLMDVQMPVMDGLEATRRIRADPELADTRIIAMTANASSEDRERCFAAGMNNFITKPVFADDLYAVLVECMQAGSAERIKPSRKLETAGSIQDGYWDDLGLPDEAEEIKLIDLSVLAKMVGEDPAKIEKYAHKFLVSARQGIAEIEAAIHAADAAKVAALGHRNKSPARTVGATAYADLCQSLEQFKNGGDLQPANQIVEQMKNMLEKIAAQIERDASA